MGSQGLREAGDAGARAGLLGAKAKWDHGTPTRNGRDPRGGGDRGHGAPQVHVRGKAPRCAAVRDFRRRRCSFPVAPAQAWDNSVTADSRRQRNRLVRVNENQRRTLAAALTLLDEVVCLFGEYAAGREVHGVMVNETNRLTADQRRRLQAEIEGISSQMRRMKDDLGMPTRTRDVTMKLRGQAASAWAMLSDAKSARLGAYGAVAPELAAYVDRSFEDLAQRLLSLSAILGTDDPGQSP